MALNQKAIKVLGKVFEAGFTDEKSIAAMTMDDILAIQGVTISWAAAMGCSSPWWYSWRWITSQA